jgi:hypothetical protein
MSLNLLEDPRVTNYNYPVIPARQDIVKETIEFIHIFHISDDDALHVCVANRYRCNYFITSDQGLKRQTEGKTNFRILDIENDKIDELLQRRFILRLQKCSLRFDTSATLARNQFSDWIHNRTDELLNSHVTIIMATSHLVRQQ